MFHRFTRVIAGLALIAVPGVAQAAGEDGEILLSSTVLSACAMGAPTAAEINLGDLTGPDGTLSTALTSNNVSGSTTILSAWCNGPHSLAVEGYPMTLTATLPYAQSSNMTRKINFNAAIVGWAYPMIYRPNAGGSTAISPVDHAFAAPASGLKLNISRLQALTAANVEQAGLMLEAGTYRGIITITLSAGG